jgi:hypothetical protein
VAPSIRAANLPAPTHLHRLAQEVCDLTAGKRLDQRHRERLPGLV